MRVVTYARLSVLASESEGTSLKNQERSFTRWLEANKVTRVRAYREVASAATTAGRSEFSRMIAELTVTAPDAIVIDTLDRFTRNLREGLELLEHLRGHKVGLLPLDWRRLKPIDVDDDRDWRDVVDEFTSAEWERRKIRRRILRSYDGRREAGKTLTNRGAYGVIRTIDGNLVPDPSTAWVVQECDRLVSAGQALDDVHRYALHLDPNAWKSVNGYRSSLRSTQYVRSGVRSPEMQRAIQDRLDLLRKRYGKTTKHEHEFTGFIACGLCVDSGYAPEDSLMIGIYQQPQPKRGRLEGAAQIACSHVKTVDKRHGTFYLAVPRFEAQWRKYLAVTADEAWLDAWASGTSDDAEERARALHRRLSEIDQKAARLKDRRDAALDLFSSAGVRGQAEQALREIAADEAALVATRETILGELASTPQRKRDPERLRALLAKVEEIYERASLADRNELNRALCAAIGSHPVVRREGRNRWTSEVSLTWPEVDGAEAVAAIRSRGKAHRPKPPSRR